MSYKIALLIETSNAYSRGLLKGINAYFKEYEPLSVYLGEYSRGGCNPDWLIKWRGDGIIARIENKEMEQVIRDLSLPVVDVSSGRLIPGIPWVETDDKAIAAMAFNHLVGRGFTNFGFCGAPYNWSEWRLAAFNDRFQEKNFRLFTHSFSETSHGEKWNAELEKLEAWLIALPKPIGIFAAFDIRGRQIIETCQMLGINVPEEVAVLGVDNDELLCELCNPPLSSIVPDTFRTGYIAAELLYKMLKGEKIGSFENRITPIGVVQRRSTDIMAITDPHISKALHFIHENALKGPLTVSEVTEQLPMSRRVFEIKFKKNVGRTPYEEIMRLKITRIKELLLETDISLLEIAERVGIQHQSYMGYIFNKEVGISPGLFRKQHR